MSQRIKAAYSPGAAWITAPANGGLSRGALAAYRAATEDLVQEAAHYPGPSDPGAVAELAAKRLAEPEFTAVLAQLDGGADAAADRIAGEIRGYEASNRRSASDFP